MALHRGSALNVLETIVGGRMPIVTAIVGAIVASLVCVFGFTQAEKNLLGTALSELSSIKRECELVIPRNQQCVASIVFLPTAIEE